MLDALSRVGLSDVATVVLVGSGARDAMNGRSDIDFLVLYDDGSQIRLDRPGDIHVQQDSRLRFLRRLEDGDDYPGWALRFGVLIHDPDGWWAKHVDAELDSPHWPDWRAKVVHAKKRISLASEMLHVGDIDAACEELMFAASHVARATLLKYGTFPLSRPEMPTQLKTIEPDLARLLARLIRGDMDAASLRSGESMLNHQIEQLQQPTTLATLPMPSVQPQK